MKAKRTTQPKVDTLVNIQSMGMQGSGTVIENKVARTTYNAWGQPKTHAQGFA